MMTKRPAIDNQALIETLFWLVGGFLCIFATLR